MHHHSVDTNVSYRYLSPFSANAICKLLLYCSSQSLNKKNFSETVFFKYLVESSDKRMRHRRYNVLVFELPANCQQLQNMQIVLSVLISQTHNN